MHIKATERQTRSHIKGYWVQETWALNRRKPITPATQCPKCTRETSILWVENSFTLRSPVDGPWIPSAQHPKAPMTPPSQPGGPNDPRTGDESNDSGFAERASAAAPIPRAPVERAASAPPDLARTASGGFRRWLSGDRNERAGKDQPVRDGGQQQTQQRPAADEPPATVAAALDAAPAAHSEGAEAPSTAAATTAEGPAVAAAALNHPPLVDPLAPYAGAPSGGAGPAPATHAAAHPLAAPIPSAPTLAPAPAPGKRKTRQEQEAAGASSSSSRGDAATTRPGPLPLIIVSALVAAGAGAFVWWQQRKAASAAASGKGNAQRKGASVDDELARMDAGLRGGENVNGDVEQEYWQLTGCQFCA
jgi:hypothetical protein